MTFYDSLKGFRDAANARLSISDSFNDIMTILLSMAEENNSSNERKRNSNGTRRNIMNTPAQNNINGVHDEFLEKMNVTKEEIKDCSHWMPEVTGETPQRKVEMTYENGNEHDAATSR